MNKIPSSPENDYFIKVVLIGDPKVGKSAFFSTLLYKKHMPPIPSTIEHTYIQVQNGINPMKCLMFDTNTSEQVRLRPLAYPKTNIFLLFFNLLSKPSFDNITKVFMPELKKFADLTSSVVILVGSHSDLIESGSRAISNDDVHNIVEKFNFSGYLECNNTNIDLVTSVLEESIRSYQTFLLHKQASRAQKSCTLL